jgi:dTDP-glucose 4,6-dehydratase
MKNILVTGGRGFIGFNAICLWKKSRLNLNFVNIDANTYADKFLENKKNKWLEENNIPSFTVDLGMDSSQEAVESIIDTFEIDTICHFGAESHVDNSLNGPIVFFKSNVLGTVNLIEVARKRDIRFHYVSTDEVYGITHPADGITIDSPMRPSSPYSSSKASADLIVQSYMKSFGLRATISRCSNNFGPMQMSEKMIPTILRKLANKEKIPVYGDGQQKRQWIYVDDHNKAILDIMEGEPGKICNVSSNEFGYMTNLDLVGIFAEMYGRKTEDVVEFVEDRKAHDTSYFITNYSSLDYGKSHIREMMVKTCEWYRKNEQEV